jgi:hypothetical protein
VTATVTASWSNSSAVISGFTFPFPAARPLQIPVANTAGDWMLAIVTWRQVAAGAGVTVSVADDAHNYWEPLGAPSGDSAAAGVTRTAIWYAPAARAAQFVQACPTGNVLSIAALILDVAGMSKWFTLTAITPGFANANTALSLGIGAPASSAFMLAVVGTDNLSFAISGPGAGWSAQSIVTASNGTDTTADLQLTAAWQTASTAQTAAWTSAGTLDLSGVTAGILVTTAAPAQPNPNWPVVITELAPGAGVATPPSQITWTPISARSLAMTIQQGRQYTMGQLQAGQGTLTIDNPDGALIPPGTGAFAGIDSGTPVRQRMIWPSSATPYYVPFSGFYQRWPFAFEADMLRGKTDATILDVWAYAGGTQNSMAREELLLDSPYALWPLNDPVGSTTAANLAPGNSNPLVLVTSKLGAGGATEAFGANSSSGLTGDSSAKTTTSGKGGGASGMWSQILAGTSQNTNGYGFALVCADTGYPLITNGVTIDGWFDLRNNNGQVFGFTAATTGSLFTCSANFPNGTPVVMTTASGFTIPGGFATGAIYYVISASGQTFQLSNSLGGSAITVTSSGGGFIQATTPWNSVIWSARNVKGVVVELDVSTSNGNLLLTYQTAAGNQGTITLDSLDHRFVGGMVYVSVAFSKTAYQVQILGVGNLMVSGNFPAPLPSAFTEFDAGGIQDRSFQGGAWGGYSALLGIYPGMLASVRTLSHYWAGAPGLPGEAPYDRIERILEYAGLTGRRCLLQHKLPNETVEVDRVVSGQDIGGQPAATSVNNIASSTLPAMMYVAPTGDIFYLDKYHAWDQPVKWVLGDGPGEIPFKPAQFATDYDPARVVNDIQLTQLDTSAITIPSGAMAATTMAAVEAASRAQYGDITYQQTGYLQYDASSAYTLGAGLNDLANWLASVYAKPHNRVQGIVVDAASHPSSWPFVAGASVGDMVQVSVRPPTAATSPLISLVARVTQTNRSTEFSQSAAAGSVTCVLDFAPEYNALTCDDAARGLLNGSNVIGW